MSSQEYQYQKQSPNGVRIIQQQLNNNNCVEQQQNINNQQYSLQNEYQTNQNQQQQQLSNQQQQQYYQQNQNQQQYDMMQQQQQQQMMQQNYINQPFQLQFGQLNPFLDLQQFAKQLFEKDNKISKLNQENSISQVKIQEFTEQVNNDRRVIKNLEQMKKEYQDLQITYDIEKSKLEQYEIDLEKLNKKLKQKEFDFNQKLNYEGEKFKQKIEELNDDIDKLKKEKERLIEKQQKQPGQASSSIINEVMVQHEQEIKKIKLQLEEERNQVKSLSLRNQSLIYQNQQNGEGQLNEQNKQINKLNQDRESFLNELAQLKKKNKELDQENENQKTMIIQIQGQLKEKDRKIRNQQDDQSQLENKIEQQQLMIKKYEEIIQNMRKQNYNQANQYDYQLDELKQFQINMKQKEQDNKKMKEDQEKKEYQDQLKKQQDNIRFEELEKENRRKQAKLIRQKMMASHGQLDVCFLIDVTKSMDPYKLQTQACIKGSMSEIKRLTNRDANWAAVCYQDIKEKQLLKGYYQQKDFCKDPKEMESWLQKVQCNGGDDISEDIKGGIKQICQNLNWKSMFRIAILICDAPCHGRQYHDQSISDNYPNEDITDAIDLLINLEILFIGLNFNQKTSQMYNVIQQIYKQRDKQELFMLVDMIGTKLDEIAKCMVQKIGQASEKATQTNVNSTKSKNQIADKQKRDGAMEALCKTGNFLQFEKTVPIVIVNFDVIRVELKDDSFNNNIKTIHNIKVPQDYQLIIESTWNCIRTSQPFAYGMMKAVFLMKKQNNQNELYVVKTPLSGRPYNSMNEALSECRSHLLCQKLMKKFMNEIDNAIQDKKLKKMENVCYSDFLILKESNTAFWIAEKFFNGEFVKYNNNFGYINDEGSSLNKIAQAFTYYTFLNSDFNYIVNDIQGVGRYFTDPAINTKRGDFDETDMGENGMSMYMANFGDQKLQMCQEILSALKLIDNQRN